MLDLDVLHLFLLLAFLILLALEEAFLAFQVVLSYLVEVAFHLVEEAFLLAVL